MAGQLYWLESVPAGLRWFCYGCTAEVRGLSEVDEDEAGRRMIHDPECEETDGRAAELVPLLPPGG